MDLPRRSELFARFRAAALATPNTRISAREIDRPGSDANLVGAGASFVGEEVVARMARALAGVFEATASGKALDRIIFDRKGISRLPAAPAVGEVVLERPGAGAGAGTIDGGLPGTLPAPARIQTNRGIVYTLSLPQSFGALDLGPFTVPVQAELAGLDYEVEADQAWSWVDAPFDPTIAITNPDPMAGASDEETDEAYKARARAFFPTLRRGTLGAIEFGLRSTPGVASAVVYEVLQASGVPAAVVQAYILDALGRANETFAARAYSNLLQYRALGIPVLVGAGEVEYVAIRLRPTWDTAVVTDTAAGWGAVQNAIVAALQNLRPGQTLERSLIYAAARSVSGLLLPDGALELPTGDLVPSTTSSALRTLPELITGA